MAGCSEAQWPLRFADLTLLLLARRKDDRVLCCRQGKFRSKGSDRTRKPRSRKDRVEQRVWGQTFKEQEWQVEKQ